MIVARKIKGQQKHDLHVRMDIEQIYNKLPVALKSYLFDSTAKSNACLLKI
uniref:Uncharacterized protein n=1 Tax=Arundo donax TaxID=35708 RepID=A0A0A9A9L2_ARUDO